MKTDQNWSLHYECVVCISNNNTTEPLTTKRLFVRAALTCQW